MASMSLLKALRLLWLCLLAAEGANIALLSDGSALLQTRSRQGVRTNTSLGSPCDIGATEACGAGLECTCLALNRGLHVCMEKGYLAPPKWARKFERQGEVCAAELPKGLTVMPPAPVVMAAHKVIDPRKAKNEKLRHWAVGPGRKFYSQYATIRRHSQVRSSAEDQEGIVVLAGDDVPHKKVLQTVEVGQHFLVDSAVRKDTLSLLAKSGVRLLISGAGLRSWEDHPEVHKHFKTGLGGGAPWFPSTGIMADEAPYSFIEEMFHTMQYVAFKPRDVCMYHKAYAGAMTKKLYKTDHSGPEIDGEPVPTVQADEYLAMALHRWLGSHQAHDEYLVKGSSKTPGKATGRENLRKHDVSAFCILSTFFRSDDDWNPMPTRSPWKTNPNRGMDREEVATLCEPVLKELARGCPSSSLEWPSHSKP